MKNKLTPEQIKENWDALLSCIDRYIPQPRKDKLLSFYERHELRLGMMPASHKKGYHSCFEGGYVFHVLNVLRFSLQLHKIWKLSGSGMETYTLEELAFSAINHDLGKMGTEDQEAYTPSGDKWRMDKLGEMYEYNNKIPFMTVPDRSIFLLHQEGIELSMNEFLAIKLHDGLYDKSNEQYLLTYMPEKRPRTALVYILHMADMLASRKEFEEDWLAKLE